MLISFYNPNDLIGCGGDINQSHSFRYTEGYMEGVSRGGMWRGMQRGYTERICGVVYGGDIQRGNVEGVCGGSAWRGYAEGYTEGYT